MREKGRLSVSPGALRASAPTFTVQTPQRWPRDRLALPTTRPRTTGAIIASPALDTLARLIDTYRARVPIGAVELRNRGARILIVGHLDKPKAFALPCRPISNNDRLSHFAIRRKTLRKRFIRCGVREIPDIDTSSQEATSFVNGVEM